MKKIIIIFLIAYCGYSCSSANRMQKSGNYITAIDNAIMDYLKTKFSKKERIFVVNQRDLDNDIIAMSISPNVPIICLFPDDTLGSPRYNIRYIEKGEKLFYWYDDGYHLTAEAISTLAKYGATIWPIQSFNWLDDYFIDDAAKGPQYFFCKNNLTKYRKKVTNIAIEWYTPPKLKCK